MLLLRDVVFSGNQNQNLFSGSVKSQDFHVKSTEALMNSETNTFRSENVSFSSIEVSDNKCCQFWQLGLCHPEVVAFIWS